MKVKVVEQIRTTRKRNREAQKDRGKEGERKGRREEEEGAGGCCDGWVEC